MIVGGEKPSLDELRHFGIKGMKWGIRRAVSRLNPSTLMTVKEGTPAAKRIQRESDARQKVIEAMTDEQHKKALDHLAQAQMMNRIEVGKTKVADLVKRHGAISVKTMSH